MKDILTEALKEVLLGDNLVTDTEVGIIRFAARSRWSRCVDTAGELLHTMDHIVETNLSPSVWIRPIPAVCS